MTLSPLERDLMRLATDDHFFFWEFLAEIKPHFSEASEQALIGHSQELLKKMIKQKLMIVCEGHFFSGEEKALPEEQALAHVEDPKQWQGSGKQSGLHIRCTATEEGLKVYRACLESQAS